MAPATSPTGSAPASSGAASQVHVVVTNAGCVPDRSSVPSGGVVFNVLNEGGDAVPELELFEGEHFQRLGEVENLAPGLSGTFALDLKPGPYVLFCPGATTDRTAFTVTGEGASSGEPVSELDELLGIATAGYDEYVQQQVASLVTATDAFTAAVKAGDIEQAKALYGPARLYYERIESVAESFGDLDPQIDGREDDAASPAEFTGFHRLEKALWVDANVADMGAMADKLSADVTHLNELVATADYQPAQLANGAAELLDEISRSKITGEEERYSHIDLLDFRGNLDGARRAFDLLSPALATVDPQLNTTIGQRFTTVETMLAQYKRGDGYALYPELTTDQTRDLAQAVNDLAEPMSQVAAKIVSQ